MSARKHRTGEVATTKRTTAKAAAAKGAAAKSDAAKKRSHRTDDGHNESCVDMARELGEQAGQDFSTLPEEEKQRLLRERVINEMPWLAALYESDDRGETDAHD